MMTDKQFDARLRHIDDQAAAMQERVDAYRDQKMAQLFAESEWSQEQIAEKVGKDRSWVTRHFCFARFLEFVPNGHETEKLPKNFTERKFREYWDKTERTTSSRKGKAADADEKARFAEVLRQMQDEYILRKPDKAVAKAIAERAATGEWMWVEQVAEAIRPDVGEVGNVQLAQVMSRIRKNNAMGLLLETKHRVSGHRSQYRISKIPKGFQKLKASDIRAAASKAVPALKAIVEMARDANAATVDLNTFLIQAEKAARALEPLLKAFGAAAAD